MCLGETSVVSLCNFGPMSVYRILHQKQIFETIKPMNFATVATPHLGLLRYSTFYSRLSFILGPFVLSRTGDQFFGIDSWSTTGLPLLEVMADPGELHSFIQASFIKFIQRTRSDILPSISIIPQCPNIREWVGQSAFRNHIELTYMRSINDQTVPYASAGIVATDPFAGHETSRFIVCVRLLSRHIVLFIKCTSDCIENGNPTTNPLLDRLD